LTIETFANTLAGLGGQRILVLCHDYADADAIGSALALAELVGGSPGVPNCIAEHTLSFYHFLDGGFCIGPDPANYDLTIVVDCASEDQLPGIRLPSKFLLIDHHRWNSLQAAAALALHQIEDSTCQLVYRIYQALGHGLSRRTALALAGGIATDTVNLKRAGNRTLMELATIMQQGGITLQEVLHQLRYSGQMEKMQRLQIAGQSVACAVGDLVFAFVRVEPGNEYYGTMLLTELGADVALAHSQHAGTVAARLAVGADTNTIDAQLLLARAIGPDAVGRVWGHRRFAGHNGDMDPELLVLAVREQLEHWAKHSGRQRPSQPKDGQGCQG
jgi:phosphoesterase RecJ-like protein